MMRVLLSTIGSRGDVQPLVALALQLRSLGQEARLCVPPRFRDWIDGLRLPVTPLSPGRRDQTREATVAAQFETLAAAARGCDVIVGTTIAAPSVAEWMGIPYVFAAFCPILLPSPHHAPLPRGGEAPATATADHCALWAQDARRWDSWRPALDAHRTSAGLGPVCDVRRHVLTGRPWLAADPALAPWPDPADPAVFQTGAWILPDARPLSPELEAFLAAGEPPVYFGFGSSRAPRDLSRVMIAAARALGRRAIVSRGWAGLSLVDDAPDCLAIGDANHPALFERVAAVVHHGGAGTTTAAALAGAPQVIIPQISDQHYWARRIHHLGIGSAHAPGTPTTESLASALEHAVRPCVAARAVSFATMVRSDGAHAAAQRLIATGPQSSF